MSGGNVTNPVAAVYDQIKDTEFLEDLLNVFIPAMFYLSVVIVVYMIVNFIFMKRFSHLKSILKERIYKLKASAKQETKTTRLFAYIQRGILFYNVAKTLAGLYFAIKCYMLVEDAKEISVKLPPLRDPNQYVPNWKKLIDYSFATSVLSMLLLTLDLTIVFYYKGFLTRDQHLFKTLVVCIGVIMVNIPSAYMSILVLRVAFETESTVDESELISFISALMSVGAIVFQLIYGFRSIVYSCKRPANTKIYSADN